MFQTRAARLYLLEIALPNSEPRLVLGEVDGRSNADAALDLGAESISRRDSRVLGSRDIRNAHRACAASLYFTPDKPGRDACPRNSL